jgi:hypothetical protein
MGGGVVDELLLDGRRAWSRGAQSVVVTNFEQLSTTARDSMCAMCSPSPLVSVIDQSARFAVDERLHVANEVVREPDIEPGRGFEPRHCVRGQ